MIFLPGRLYRTSNQVCNMKNEQYKTMLSKEDERDYFRYFNSAYWIHKAKVLPHFIEDPSQVAKLRFQGDKDTEETIINNLKMELHMMVFHSTETLFLNLFSIVKMPEYPWIWIFQCTPSSVLSKWSIIKELTLSKIHLTYG